MVGVKSAEGVAEFVRVSRRLRSQLTAAEQAWQLWYGDEARLELRRTLQPHTAGGDGDRRDGGGGGDGGACRQLVTDVNQVRRRVLRLRELCQPPVRHQDLPVIRRVADSVRTQTLAVSQRCAQRLVELKEEEAGLAAAVSSLCDRLSRWSISPRRAAGRRPATAPAGRPTSRGRAAGAASDGQPTGTTPARHHTAEVSAYDTFLSEHGGLSGGWDEADHALFLKLRARHRGLSKLCQALSQQLPTKTVSEVVEHVQWHDQLVSLTERRRQAVRAWRESRQLQSAAASAPPPAAEEPAAERVGPSRGGHRRLNSRQPARKQRPPAPPPPAPPPPAPPPAARQRWQREQERRRALAAEHRQRRQQEEERTWRLQQQTRGHERQLRARLAAKTLQVYRRRDAEQMERQKAARLQRARQVAPPTPVRPRPAAGRCPARLLAETSATWRRRQAAETHPGPVSVGLSAVPRRGVPQWRSGL